jgi:hypothetical protein
MSLLDISTEVKLPKKRIDILLSNEASNFALGVEIKRKREIDDLGKLGTFMDEEKISILVHLLLLLTVLRISLFKKALSIKK